MVIGNDDPKLFSLLLEILQNRGVGILPCDTIYGLVGAAPATEARIRELKTRNDNKQFLQLIPSTDWLKNFTSQTLPRELAAYWPGALTIIFKRKKGAGKVALRMPRDELLTKLLLALDMPLYSTSVNYSGRDFLWKIEEIKNLFRARVDIIVDAGDLPGKLPSTIVDISAIPYKLVRQGAVTLPGSFFS